MTMLENRRTLLRRFARFFRTRPRLFLALLAGIAVGIVLPSDIRLPTRALIGWDVAVALFLLFSFRMMVNSTADKIRRRAVLQDEGRQIILALVALVAFASLGAILFEIGGAKEERHSGNLILAALTILLSWTFTHIIFALYYAHEYYDANAHRGGGLNFPGDATPDYWDFVYFSLVVGMTSQVSDIAVTSQAIRRTVSAHGVVSFIFNATLIALAVNIAAGAL
jgi:uncharacterized membrane protein